MAIQFLKNAGRKTKILLWVLLVLIIIRLLLPYAVLKYLNHQLANLDGYYGQIDDIDLAIYRGAYVANSFYLNKVDSSNRKESKFIKIKETDISVEWQALFDGKLVGEFKLINPEVYFVQERTEVQEVVKDSSELKKIVDISMPLKINRIEVVNGIVHYIDPTVNPEVDVFMDNIELLAENLKNTQDKSEKLPSTITMTASAYEGDIKLNMKLDPLAAQPVFDINADVKEVDLVKLNDFMNAYAGVDVNKGTFGMYTEIATDKGNFKGYVKPIIKDLDVLGKEDKNDPVFRKIWEGFVGTVGTILTNPSKDQVATKIPLKGKLNDPKVGVFESVWEVLKNAFIQALMPSIDQEIDIQSVQPEAAPEKKGFLKRIFNGKDKKEKE